MAHMPYNGSTGVDGIESDPYSADYGRFQALRTASSDYGTEGTLSGITANTTNTSTAVTGLTVGHAIPNGSYVTFAGMDHAFVLSGVGATTATLNRAATATLTGATVQYIERPDPQAWFGYNLNSVSNELEPEYGMKIEANYLDADGYLKLEFYLQYQNAGSTVLVRPIFASVNKSTERVQEVVLNGGTQGFKVVGGIGDGSTDGNIMRAKQTAGNPLTLFGDFAAFDTLGLVHRGLHAHANDIASIAASTYNKKLINVAAYDADGGYVQIYGYDYVGSAGIPLKLNQYGGATTMGGSLGVTGNFAVNGATVAAKPTVTGSRGSNAALADLLTKLAAMGLITDGTS